MHYFKTFVSLFAIILVAAVGCDSQSEEAYNKEKTELRKNLDETLNEVENDLATLEKKGSRMAEDAEIQEEIENQKENLEENKAELEDKLQNLKETSEDEWEEFKMSTEKLLDKVSKDLEEVRIEIREETSKDKTTN